MAVFTIVIAGAAILQWREMVGGGTQTDKLVDYAKVQANAASDIGDAAQQFSDTADDTNNSISDAVDQLKAAAENTRTTIRNAQSAFRDEQRAWVGVSEAGTVDFSEPNPWTVAVIFFNSGRTPARNVQASVRYKLSSVPLSGPPPEEIPRLTFHPVQSIAPQGKFNFVVGFSTSAQVHAPEEMVGNQDVISNFKAIKAKTVFIYYFGILKYDDVFGHPRQTQFCIFLANPDTKQAGFCDTFNDLN
jgi:gas vesicle protein